jgi:hypothetical protein
MVRKEIRYTQLIPVYAVVTNSRRIRLRFYWDPLDSSSVLQVKTGSIVATEVLR